MNRVEIYSIFIVLLLTYYQICSDRHHKKSIPDKNFLKDRIVFAIDPHEEVFTKMELKLANDLFDINIINSIESFTNDTDIIGHTDWNNIMKMYKKSSLAHTNTLLPNTKQDIELFRSKVLWHEWMNNIGLSNMVPHTYSVTGNKNNLKFPLVLRTNRNFGRGSFIIANKNELSFKISELLAKDKSFMLEESLSGLGQREITVFGGAYKGRLLSMRCMMREFATATATTSSSTRTTSSSGNTTIFNQNTKVTPYVRGFHLKHLHEHWLPCGRDLIAVHKKMFAATSYSGSWCSEVKLDSKMRPKILEVNARFCGSLANNDALFVLSFVPIAFAMLEADPSARIAHALQGPHNGTYRHILAQEQRALETGGGFYQRHWVTVDRFNPLLQLDPVDPYLTRRAIRAHSKIVVSVKDSDLCFRLTQLKATNTLFEFRKDVSQETQASVQRSVDLTLSSDVVTIDQTEWKESLSRLGYAAFVSTGASTAAVGNSKNGTVKVFGSAHHGTLLSMRCVRYIFLQDDYTLGTSIPKKQLVACGLDIVSVLTGYFAKSGDFTGVFCATIEMDSSGQPKFTELQTGLCEELTVSDAGFIGAYVPLAAALFTDRHQTHRISNSITPIELNWLANRNIYRHIVAVERRVLAGGGSMYRNQLLTVPFFSPLRHLNDTGYLVNKELSLNSFY